MKILVVDDDFFIRYVLTTELKYMGYEVSIAGNGSEALSMMQSEDVDFVITDFKMPYMNGIELTRAIRRNNRHQHPPILMISGTLCDDLKNEALTAGVNGFIGKPFTMDFLHQQIDSLHVL